MHQCPYDCNSVPGREGSTGPGPGQYGQPHVYARDITSGAGNCVCGHSLGDERHVQAAPGVPVPDRFRSAAQTLAERILGTVDDLVASFLYYDRKEDGELPGGAVHRILSGEALPGA